MKNGQLYLGIDRQIANRISPIVNRKSLRGRVPHQRTTSRKIGSGFSLYLFCPKAKKDAAAILHARHLRHSVILNILQL